MDKEVLVSQRDGGHFHPGVYKILAALAVWFVLSAWIFAGGGMTDPLLVVVSGIVLGMTAIPAVLALIQRARKGREEEGRADGAFGDWASRDVGIHTGPVKGAIAAIETMLPIAAVAIGMTIFGLVVRVAGH